VELIRVLRTARTTLSQTFFVDGVAIAPTGTLQVDVKRLDGTAISGSPFTYTVNETTCSFSLPDQASLDTFTAEWQGTVAGAVVKIRDVVEIVGGFLFNLAAARRQLRNIDATFTMADMAALRTEVEQVAERISGGVAFVPRFKRVKVTGTGRTVLALPHPLLRAVRAVSVDGVAWTQPQVDAIGVSDSGVLYAEGAIFTEPITRGRPNIIVEYEHGMDMPPGEVTRQGIVHARSLVGVFDSGTPQNAVSFSVADGGVYRLAMPSRVSTGVPTVDAAYARAALDMGGFA